MPARFRKQMFFERTQKCLSSVRICDAMDDSALNLRVFDLHYANLQSIGKAQKVHLTTLMVYLGVVWGWYIVGEGTSVTIQMLGLAIKAKGFWVSTPLIVTFFSLALIGSVNAAGPTRKKLDATLKKLGMEKEFEFYDLDMHKNVLDYFTYLRLRPEKTMSEVGHQRFRIRHFLYVTPVLIGIYTTWFAMRRPELSGVHWFWLYAGSCLILQIACCVRPFWRALCRFLGIRRDKTTY
jgi:hypothetical protein